MKKILFSIFSLLFLASCAFSQTTKKRVDSTSYISPTSVQSFPVLNSAGATRRLDRLTAKQYFLPQVISYPFAVPSTGACDWKGFFVKEGGSATITAYVDSACVRHAVGSAGFKSVVAGDGIAVDSSGGVYSVSVPTLNALTTAVFSKASTAALNTEIAARIAGDAAMLDSINYVSENTATNYALKSDLSIGAGNVYYVDNSRWKNAGETRGGTIYTAQLNAAKRGSIIYSYPTIWAARNAAVRDSATVPEPVIHILGGTHYVGLATTPNQDTLDFASPTAAMSYRVFYPSSADSMSPALNYNRLSYVGDDGTTIKSVEQNVRLFNDLETSRIDSLSFRNISIVNKKGSLAMLYKASVLLDFPKIGIDGGDNYIFSLGTGQSIVNIKELKTGVGFIGNYWSTTLSVGRQRPVSVFNIGTVLVDSINQNHNLIGVFQQRNIAATYNIGDLISNKTDAGVLQMGWYFGSAWCVYDSSNVNININRFYQRRSYTGTFTQGIVMAQVANATTVGSRFSINIKDADVEMPILGHSSLASNFKKDTLYINIEKALLQKGKGNISSVCDLGASDAATVITISGNYEVKDFSSGFVIPSTFTGKLILDNCYIKSNNDIPLITNNSASAKVVIRNSTLVVGGAATNSITGTGSVIVESARSNAAVSGSITQKGNTVSVSTDFNY